MTEPRPLQEQELRLIQQYIHCNLKLSPRQFYARWDISYEAIAAICGRSSTTVRRWFSRGSHYRAPSSSDLYHLALVDFLLQHHQEIPVELFDTLCPPHSIDSSETSEDI
ncbi:MAG: helix-turn-helix domain-containing protein [Leptolyngbyaceae cyanobacterium bins.302]|nr:helix-turn-helix domain-containing protein [Leptolyngbyaceae cyanobacterium bins.302]